MPTGTQHPRSTQQRLPLAACRLDEGSNALVLPAKADRPTDGEAAEPAAAPEKRLSKSQQRKLRKIQEEKEKRAKRADVMQTLAQHQVRACMREGRRAGPGSVFHPPPVPSAVPRPMPRHALLGCPALTPATGT